MLFKRARKPIDLSVSYKQVFKGEGESRIVLNDILNRGRVLSNIYDIDPREHAYNEGRRSLALEILHMVGMDIEEAEERLKEWAENDKKYNL